jgi:hypothetical protein
MNSPPDGPSDAPPLPLFSRGWLPVSGKGIVEEYLDAFCLPLHEVMSRQEVAEYRLIAREHVEALIAEFEEEQGLPHHPAVHAALREHGDADHLGRLLQAEWLKGGVGEKGKLRRRLPVRTCALRVFLALGVLNTAVLVAPRLVEAASGRGGTIGGVVIPLLFLFSFFSSAAVSGAMVGAAWAIWYERRFWLPFVGLPILFGVFAFTWGSTNQRESITAFLMFWLPPALFVALPTAEYLDAWERREVARRALGA